MLKVKEILKTKGLTQTDLAQKLGISKVALSNTLNGNPTLSSLVKISEVLEVHITDLFEPDTDNFITLYRKDEQGNYIEYGQVRKD